ncbi:MAG: hypothetical protein IT425_09325 [Pirellulales bacterium]|nr:hypothetical protein [Pirellulales bacterium]
MSKQSKPRTSAERQVRHREMSKDSTLRAIPSTPLPPRRWQLALASAMLGAWVVILCGMAILGL